MSAGDRGGGVRGLVALAEQQYQRALAGDRAAVGALEAVGRQLLDELAALAAPSWLREQISRRITIRSAHAAIERKGPS